MWLNFENSAYCVFHTSELQEKWYCEIKYCFVINSKEKQVYLRFMPSKYVICNFLNKSASATIPLKSWYFLLCFSSHYLIFHYFLLGLFSLLFSSLLFLFLFTFLHCLSFFCFPFESVFSTFSVNVKPLILHFPFGSCLYSLSLHSQNFFSFCFFN